LVFKSRWLRAAGIAGTLLALIATLFLSTRAFYLGTIALTIVLLLFIVIRYRQSNDKKYLKLAGIYLSIVFFAFFIFSTTQHYLYPKEVAKSLSVEARLATITDPSGGGRFRVWNWSWQLFKQSPILGVGLGNWKVEIPKIENQTSPDFIYAYKSHNDFLEIAAETGVFGGLFFVTLFLLAGITLVVVLFKNPGSEYLPLLFLAVFGLVCYSFDAFFNFPQDRPEIQALFALYVGALTVFSFQYHSKKEEAKLELLLEKWIGNIDLNHKINSLVFKNQSATKGGKIDYSNFRKVGKIAGMLVMVLCVYILYLNYISLRLQRIVLDDKNLTQKADVFVTQFPDIPSLGV